MLHGQISGKRRRPARAAAAFLFLCILIAGATAAGTRTRAVRAPAVIVPSASGSWPMWRGNPQHSGFQRLPGRIVKPSILWKFGLGGGVDPRRFILSRTGESEMLVISTGDGLAAKSMSGHPLWFFRLVTGVGPLGSWDLTGDGKEQILGVATSSHRALMTFDPANGKLISSIDVPGEMATVKVLDLDGDGIREVLWAPSASSRIAVYSFRSGQARALWDVEVPDYISDPYTPSGVVVGTLRNGKTAIFVAGGRWQVPILALDAANGQVLWRRTFAFEGHGLESGGNRQVVALGASSRLIAVSDYQSNEIYMFQGAISASAADPAEAVALDTYPAGLHFVDGSITDFDGDGSEEILVSRFDAHAQRHDLLLLDGTTLVARAVLHDFYLRAIVPAGDRSWGIVGHVGAASEIPAHFGRLAGCTLNGGILRRSSFSVARGGVPVFQRKTHDDRTIDYPGNSTISFPAAAGGRHLLIELDVDDSGVPSRFASVDPVDGSAQRSYSAPPGASLTILRGPVASVSGGDNLFVSRSDGWVIGLDSSLSEVQRFRVDNFTGNGPGNSHTAEVAAVTDLDGSGRPDVVIVDSASRIARLDTREAGPQQQPTATALWAAWLPQEILTVLAGRGTNLVVRRIVQGRPRIGLIDGRGGLQWEHEFGRDPNVVEDALPLGVNWGRVSEAVPVAIVASGGARATFPRSTYLFNARDGSLLWRSSNGTFWDATFAVGDFDGDSLDDFVFNHNIDKGMVLSGRDAAVVALPAILPPHRELGRVDYNGTPIVAAIDGDSIYVVNAEDNAHTAMLRYPLRPSLRPRAEVAWAAPHLSLDDERGVSPAIAPAGHSWIVGGGSRSGWLRARRGRDGALLWQVAPSGGSLRSENADRVPLSSVVANDVDGDGSVDFVVGSADGWVYAVDAASGALKWSLDLGGPCGPPIAADIDGDGWSELLVPAGGYLFAIGAN